MKTNNGPPPSVDLHPSNEPSEITDLVAHQVDAIVEDCLRRRRSGESLTDEQLLAAHPDPELQGQLKQALVHLKMIERAFAAADGGESAPPTPPFDSASNGRAASQPTSVTGLRIRCPHCFTPSDRVPDTPWEKITCTRCGGTYRLAATEGEGEGEREGALKSIGHFDLIERIGVGGFGTVWKAHDKELDRYVAIKLPRRGQLTPAETEQFFREARAAAQLRHPNIVAVHEVGCDHDRLFIVSDFVQGESLAARGPAPGR